MFQYIGELPALADFFCDALSDLKHRMFFDSRFLDLLIAEVRDGRSGTHAGIVWDLAVLETWMASRGIAPDGSGRLPLPIQGDRLSRVRQG
jgi:hypothetical protein